MLKSFGRREVAATPTRTLLRVLGVGFGIAVSLGNSIGSGIMRTPATIAGQLPRARLVMLAWVIGGCYSLFGAWSLAEVGAMIPSAGGYYTVARRAFGDYVSFVVGWADWISLCGAVAATALVAGEYLADLGCPLGHSKPATAAAIVALVSLVQWRSVRWGSRFQTGTSAVTAVVFFALVVVAFAAGPPSPATPTDTAQPLPMPAGGALFVAWVLVLQAVIYTYDGWYSAIYFGDEIVHPGVELPRSMINGVLLLIAIYLCTNAALFYALDVSTLARENLPIAAIGGMIFGDRGRVIVRALMTVTLVGLANASIQCASRILYAMGRDGWGSTRLAYVHARGTPTVALLVSALVALVLLVSASFERVLAVTAFFYLSKYLLSYVAVFSLRRREPFTQRPYLAFGYPWTTAVAVAVSIAFLAGAVAADTRNSLYGLALLVVSYPAYRTMRKGRNQYDRSVAT